MSDRTPTPRAVVAGVRADIQPRADAEASAALIERARAGDQAALETLYSRHLPLLMRWASGRLPRWSRDVLDTSDLVQETVLHSLKGLSGFECRGEGALMAYLRQGIVNRIKDQTRNAARRPLIDGLDSGIRDAAPSPLEEAVGREALERYDSALQRLQDDERQAVIARLELGHSYQEIAVLLNRPSRDAARMLVARAMVKLAEEMEHAERS